MRVALADGRVLWTSPTGGDTGLLLSGSSLILAAGSELSALDLATGTGDLLLEELSAGAARSGSATTAIGRARASASGLPPDRASTPVSG